MPRSSGSSKLFLGRAMAVLALPLTPISKSKAARSLLLFKKQRRLRRLRHYNYSYVGEYQFSPSSSPLIARRPPGVSVWRRNRRGGSSRARMILATLFCGGGCGFELDAAELDGRLQPLVLEDPPTPQAVEWACDVDAYVEEEEEDWEEEEVDGRAERFIERFYEEMRLQRQSSLARRLL